MLIGLALFLTFFIMQPAFEASWAQGILPMTEGRVGELEGMRLAAEPFRSFMLANLREADLALFLDLGGGKDDYPATSPLQPKPANGSVVVRSGEDTLGEGDAKKTAVSGRGVFVDR